MKPHAILVEISARDRIGTAVTVRMCSAVASPELCLTNNQAWLPVVSSAPTITRTLDIENPNGEISIDYGQIGLRINPLFNNEIWSSYVFDGAAAKIWLGVPGAAFGTFVQIFDGQSGPLVRNSKGEAAIVLRGPETALSKEALTSVYAGTGSAEGPSTLTNTPKPRALGFCENIDAILLDPINQVYQYDGYGATQDVNALYENAINLGASTATATTYAGLVALTLKPGQWAKAPAVGMFRLGAEPSGKVTADVSGALDGSTFVQGAAAVSAYLMKQAGISAGLISASSVTAFDAVVRQPSFYAKSQTTFGDIIRKLVSDAFGYFFFNPATQRWTFGRINYSKAATTLKNDRSSLPLVKHETISQDIAQAPIYGVRVGGRRCWSVHSEGEISPVATINDRGAYDANTVYQDGDLVSYLGGSYRYYFATPAFNVIPTNASYWVVSTLPSVAAAAADAAAAVVAAAAATTALSRIASDSWLSAGEKPATVLQYNAIVADYNQLVARAGANGYTGAVLTALTTAFNSLTSYLTGLSPAYTDSTTDTAIVASTFSTRFSDYYTAAANFRALGLDVGASSFTLQAVSNVSFPTPNSVRNTSGTGGWNAKARTRENAARGATISATILGNGALGLTTDPDAAGFNTIDYSMFFSVDFGDVSVWRNGGSNVSVRASWVAGATVTITSDNTTVRYFYNNELLHSHAVNAANEVLYGTVALSNAGSTMTGIAFSAAGSAGSDGVVLSVAPTSIRFNADSSGVLKSGQISQTAQVALRGNGGQIITASANFSTSSFSGCAGSISSAGVISFTSVTSSAPRVFIRATIGSATYTATLDCQRVDDPPAPAGGGTPVTSLVANSFSAVPGSRASYAATPDVSLPGLTVGASGRVRASASFSYLINGSTTGNITIAGKMMYRVGAGAWTDTPTSTFANSSNGAAITSGTVWEPGDNLPGNISLPTVTISGLTAGATVEFGLFFYRSAGATSRSALSDDGSFNAFQVA